MFCNQFDIMLHVSYSSPVTAPSGVPDVALEILYAWLLLLFVFLIFAPTP